MARSRLSVFLSRQSRASPGALRRSGEASASVAWPFRGCPWRMIYHRILHLRPFHQRQVPSGMFWFHGTMGVCPSISLGFSPKTTPELGSSKNPPTGSKREAARRRMPETPTGGPRVPARPPRDNRSNHTACSRVNYGHEHLGDLLAPELLRAL